MSDILSIDIGGTTVKLGIVRALEVYEILESTAIDTLAQRPPEDIAGRVAQAGLALVEKHRVRLAGAGVGCPGLIDSVRGIVRNAVNLPTLIGYPVVDRLSRQLGVPVAIQNDANAAALGEFHFGQSKGCANIVLLTIGTGIGGGVICDGRLLLGNENAAAELGHLKVEYSDPAPCACGKRGCLEAYAGIEGIHRIARQVVATVPGSTFSAEMSTRQIAEAARAGDRIALEVLRRVGVYLGRGIANFIEIFAPSRVILAGGASPATPFFMPGIQQGLDQSCSFDFTRQRCDIVASSFPDTISVLGAAAVFLNTRKPSSTT